MDTKSRIKELMDERGWTIYELSKRSGLAQTTISNMWKRNTEPTIPSLRQLCDAFGITLSQFLLKVTWWSFPLIKKRFSRAGQRFLLSKRTC